MNNAITNISATHNTKINIDISYTDETVSSYILEIGKRYIVDYIDMQLHGDSPSKSTLKSINGKLLSISTLNDKSIFVPFYSGTVYIFEFDCSAEYSSNVIKITSPQIRNIVAQDNQDSDIGCTDQDHDAIHQEGYNEGYTMGIASGKSECESTHSTIRENGYNEGYNAGLAAGGNGSCTEDHDAIRQEGYNEGYNAGLLAGTGSGDYMSGYNSGYSAGYNQGYSEGLAAGGNGSCTEDHDAIRQEGYNEGYSAGLLAGTGSCGQDHETIRQEGYNQGYSEGLAAGGNSGSEDEISGEDMLKFFLGTGNLQTVTIPSNISMIKPHAFAQTTLTNITIPSNITYIGECAFQNCFSLSNIQFDQNTILYSIGGLLFNNCPIESIVLPDSVITTGGAVFMDCSSLKSVHLPNNLAQIENQLFQGCTALEEVNIPDIVQTIEPSAFDGCGLMELSFENATNLGRCGFPANCPNLETVIFPEYVGVVERSWGEFNIKTVKIPKGFHEFDLWGEHQTQMSSMPIQIPSSVTDIQFYDYTTWNLDIAECAELPIENIKNIIDNNLYDFVANDSSETKTLSISEYQSNLLSVDNYIEKAQNKGWSISVRWIG